MQSSPCLNSGICIDSINNYTCDCKDTGFFGKQKSCLTAIDIIILINALVKTFSSFILGDRCEINIDDCVGDPCKHNATCQDLVKDYFCDCYPGYTGELMVY